MFAAFALASCDVMSDPVGGPPDQTLSLAIVAGDAQQGEPGAELPDPLVVEVRDGRNKPVRDQIVNFNVIAGGGSVFAGTAITNKDGIASDYWTLGTSGAQQVEARAVTSDGEKQVFAVFTATLLITDGDGDGYTVDDGDCDDGDPAINPGAEDRPDGAFVDSNCDGVDGDLSNAVLVRPTGLDATGCGALSAPCASVNYGIQRAAALGVADVYVAAGAYSGAVTLLDGINVYGGYAEAFDARDPAVHIATLTGAGTLPIGTSAEAVTLLADGLTMATEIADLHIVGRDVSNVGKSSFAVVVRNIEAGVLTLTRNHVRGGQGGPGGNGGVGGNASATRAASGVAGANGGAITTGCDATTRGAGGAGAINGAATAARGGAGGAGGTGDTKCDDDDEADNNTATAGVKGVNATSAPPGFGVGGLGGSACVAGAHGQNGRAQHGTNGAGASSVSSLSGVLWLGQMGGAGTIGVIGTGGGGGGGAGGCDSSSGESYGAGGGGGGAGGLWAPSPGFGGAAGGGSFAVYMIASAPTLVDNTIVRGVGGTGGRGGNGGTGQPGGFGGAGGAPQFSGEAAGGNGGDGGDGGHSGAGGGGAGGISAALVRVAGSAPTLSGNALSGGAGGAGGQGGTSLIGLSSAGQDGLVVDDLEL